MIDKWGFYPCSYLEADDCLVIEYLKHKNDYNVTLVFEDKDLIQAARYNDEDEIMLNYNFNRHHKGFHKYSKHQGEVAFWSQMITGDSADNIGGIAGQGKKSKLLPELDLLETEEQMFNFVGQAYVNRYGEEIAVDVMLENFLLLNMLTKPAFNYPEVVKITELEDKANYVTKLIDL